MNRVKQNKQGVDYTGSSDHLKKKLNLNKMIANRLRILIAILVVLAGLLIYRLYTVQIVQADHFADLLEKYQTPPVTMSSMRGEFTDRNGEVLVSNKTLNSITYFPVGKALKSQERWDLAYHYAETFPVDHKLKKNDLIDLWLFLNDNGDGLITDEDRAAIDRGELNSKELQSQLRDRIDETMVATLTEDDREAFKVYVLMNSISQSSASIIDNQATLENIAYLAEHQDEFPGFSYQLSWKREMSDKIGLGSIFGGMGDISVEKQAYYLARGYQRNDQVGTYGLEYQYEELLSGEKSQYRRNGLSSELELIKEGNSGIDLRMAIDSTLQAEVERILEELLEAHKSEPRRVTNSEIQVIVSDPRTGDILSLAAINRAKDGTYYNDPQQTMLSAYPLGSTVKPATVYMGLNEGAITAGETFNDTPMYIAGTPARHSFRNLGMVNDITALQLSSNIYMFHIAIRLGNSTYIPNGPLVFKDAKTTYNTMRNYFSQFGLGVKTMVDFPREEMGYKGGTSKSGSLLEFGIGQFDNYNAMQLSQYASTVANEGYRLKPRLVIDGFDRESGEKVFDNPVTILNTLDNADAMGRIREGMRLCVVTGNCGADIMNLSQTAGAKTGTAQDHQGSTQLKNNTFIAFAPFESPEVSVACVMPHAYLDNSASALNNLCGVASSRVLQAYFDLKTP